MHRQSTETLALRGVPLDATDAQLRQLYDAARRQHAAECAEARVMARAIEAGTLTLGAARRQLRGVA
jgi:hypothetical protein